MKIKSPLIALCLAAAPVLHAQEWQSLSGIGDKLTLKAGETALIVSVSDASYVKVDKPGRNVLAVRLHPREVRDNFVTRVPNRAGGDNPVEVDWRHPFPVAGPCTIELRSPSVLTTRVYGPRPGPPMMVSRP